MKRAAAKIVQKLLNFEQKQRRMDIVWEMLTTFKDYPDLLKKLITGDESRVYGYDIEIKAQLSQRKAFCFWRYQQARFRSVSWIGKNAGLSVLYLRGVYFDGDKIIMDK